VVRPPGLTIGDTEEISEEATRTTADILVDIVLSGMATAILGVTREGLVDIVATAAVIGTPAHGTVVVGEIAAAGKIVAVGETVDGAERLAGDAVFGSPKSKIFEEVGFAQNPDAGIADLFKFPVQANTKNAS